MSYMKFLIYFSLIFLFKYSLANRYVNKDYVKELKKSATFEVLEPENNPFYYLTDEEIKSMFNNAPENSEEEISLTKHNLRPNDLKNNQYDESNFVKPPKEKTKFSDDPEHFYDFRKEHPYCVTPVRNLQNCKAAGISFALTAAMESKFCLASKQISKPILSPQYFISCQGLNCNNGGTDAKAWEYALKRGIVEEKCFPYSSGTSGKVEMCPYSCKNGDKFKVYRNKSSKQIFKNIYIKGEIFHYGPITSSFIVYQDFLSYKSGIYRIQSGEMIGTHSVAIFGYGMEGETEYWICKNSWGDSWGESGYFRIRMGEGGIGQIAYCGDPKIE